MYGGKYSAKMTARRRLSARGSGAPTAKRSLLSDHDEPITEDGRMSVSVPSRLANVIAVTRERQTERPTAYSIEQHAGKRARIKTAAASCTDGCPPLG